GFTPIQIKAVAAIIKKAKDVIITFPFDNDPDENPYKITKENYLFDLTKKNMKAISDAYDSTGVNIKKEIRLTENNRHKNNSELAYLEENLFRKGKETIKSTGSISIYKCTDIDSECHIICESILKEIEAKKYRYRDVALICADMSKYQKPLEKYLSRYEIPYYLDANRSIINNPLVKYILSITDILQYNFKAEDVLKMLRTSISPFEDEEIDKLENYIYARGIKGISKWKNEFRSLTEEQKKNLESPDEMNDLRRRFIGIFEDITKDGTKKRKLSEWIKDIYYILEAGRVAAKMTELSEELREESLISESMEYAGIYNKVIELFDALTDLMGEEDYTIKELADILKVGFSEIRVGVLPQDVDSLLVGDMQRTRLREIKALFIVGVNDGNIPNSGVSGGLLSVPDKLELKNAECALSPTSDELAYIEQLYIYLGLTKPTDKLYLSFASVGGKGESLIPSYLIEVLKNMFEDLKEEDMTASKPEKFISDIKEETGRLLGRYVSGLADNDEEKKLFENIARLRATEDGKNWCEKVIDNAFKEYTAEPLDKGTAKALYGDMLSVSISLLEQFAKCRYAHFVGYGLELSNREEFGLESMDRGNLAHNVLK
ncbi:MAG: exodeoxyribonuclease V subunit gamma, partial [Lachnospiraceae bacterium]|nr:exodeoxyribonuclease V subunit gamma [Lachnospiraceae bacterium]